MTLSFAVQSAASDNAARICTALGARAGTRQRYMVAIAGPPGAGKSTLAAVLLAQLRGQGERAVLVPMDGFHLDNCILRERGQTPRKGAPETFDFGGLEATLQRIRNGREEVATPVFDRVADLARAGARIVDTQARIVLVEGNYLLLDQAPWSRLAPLFDLTIFLQVPQTELEERLVRRWLELGHTPDAARARARSNDIPNAEYVLACRRRPDIIIEG